MALGAAGTAVAVLATAFAGSPRYLLLTMPLLGSAETTFQISRLALVAGAVPVSHRGRAVALIGGTSYLSSTAIIEAARVSGANAIHPGYGFLAESPQFAEACATAGVVFIGPSPDAMRAMGDKSSARRLAVANDVPVLPGSGEGEHSVSSLCSRASAGSSGSASATFS